MTSLGLSPPHGTVMHSSVFLSIYFFVFLLLAIAACMLVDMLVDFFHLALSLNVLETCYIVHEWCIILQ